MLSFQFTLLAIINGALFTKRYSIIILNQSRSCRAELLNTCFLILLALDINQVEPIDADLACRLCAAAKRTVLNFGIASLFAHDDTIFNLRIAMELSESCNLVLEVLNVFRFCIFLS